MALRNVVYGGCHGLEIEGAGLRFKHPGARAWRTRIRGMTRLLSRQLERVPGAVLEPKGLAVSVHYRKVPPGRRRELGTLRERVEREAPGLLVLHGKNVLEFLPGLEWRKGQAALWIARRLVRTLRPGRALVLYAGDDATDADAFAALRGHGVTVRVGARRGRADYAVKNVRGLQALLRGIERAIS